MILQGNWYRDSKVDSIAKSDDMEVEPIGYLLGINFKDAAIMLDYSDRAKRDMEFSSAIRQVTTGDD